ncbi:hypothetical protein HYV74_04145 [Candidatus Uhrbacteria bacterium]|nr:hypothetical protein [Candidatus Uhrbacteria bacterium]
MHRMRVCARVCVLVFLGILIAAPSIAATKKKITKPAPRTSIKAAKQPARFGPFTSERQVLAIYQKVSFASLAPNAQKLLCKEITRGHPKSYTIARPTPKQAAKLSELYGGCQALARLEYLKTLAPTPDNAAIGSIESSIPAPPPAVP